MNVAVVIPNWNGARFIGATLDALAHQTVPSQDVVVVDNASTDDSVEVLRCHPLRPRVIPLPANTGFGAASNIGVATTGTDLVAILNNDARPRADWLDQITRAAETSPPDVWAWGGVLLTPEGTIESAGDEWRPKGQAYKRGKGDAVDTLPKEPYEVFAPPGAGPVFRRDVFDELGGYVERFFMYYEDVDLALRARARGWRAMVVPTALVEHDLARSSRSPRAQRRVRYLVARNSLSTVLRSAPAIHPRVLARTTSEELRVARRDGYAVAYLAGRLAALGRAPRSLHERRAIVGGRANDLKAAN